MERKRHLSSSGRRAACGLALFAVLLPGGFPGRAEAQVQFESETILRVFERETSAGQDQLVLPVYEYLRGSAGHGKPGLSFHLNAWGRVDAADNDYFDDATAGEVLYAYLEYTRPFSSQMLRLGRQYVFAGVANEAVDGLAVATELPAGFSLSAYGGLPVGMTTTAGSSGDLLYGGRLGYRLGSVTEFGLSYKRVENDDLLAQELVGSDLALFLPGGVALAGVSRYNLESEDFAEHSYELRLNVAGLFIRPFFERYRYEDYFGAGAKAVNPFRFLGVQNETLTSYGADLEWRRAGGLLFGLKAKQLDRDLGDGAFYLAALLSRQTPEESAWGLEAGRLEGEESRDSYTLLRAHVWISERTLGLAGLFLAGDAVMALYDEDIRGESDALLVTLGVGRAFLQKDLTVKLAGEYGADPYYTSDVRGTLVVSYVFGR